MSISTDIALQKSLREYCNVRAQVVTTLELGFREMARAEDIMKTVAPFGIPGDHMPRDRFDEVVRNVDRTLWRTAYDRTGLHVVMDAEARRVFDRALNDHPLPFTLENIQTEILAFAQTADAMFARGVYNVFRRLSDRYLTNEREPFKIGPKCVLTYMISRRFMGGLEIRYGSSDQINDIDRVFKTLAQAPFVPRAMESAINGALKDGSIFEDDYYRCRGFKNGNAHIQFKRLDLLEKVNQIIGAYCGGNALVAA